MKTNLLRRMMAVMAAFLVTMFTLPMMAGNKVEINGVSKQVYGHDVNEVSEYVIYLSQDKKERLYVMGDNDRHATGKFVSIKSHQPVVEGQCPWVVRYVRDDRFAVQTVGYASYETALFESGAFCVTGNPRGGRFGLTLYGKITDNVKGDGNAYTFDVDFRTEWTAPIPGTFSIGQITDSSIALTWTPATDNDTPQEDLSYSVEYQKEGDDGWEMTPLTKNLTSYVIEGLDPASNYRVDVRVEDMSGNYKRYGEVSVTTKKEDFGLMIAGTEVTRGNCGDLSSINGVEGKASFDPETYTLYLDGATINGGTTNAIFMSGDKELTINVSNNVTLSSDESSVLRLMGNVTINGEGTLNVTAVDARCGIYMFKDLVIDRCTVIASGAWGIAGENGSAERLIVRAATVKATGGDYTPIADLKSLSLLGCRIVTPEGGEYNTTNHYVMLDGAPWLGTVVISPVVQQSDLVLLKQSNDGNNKAPIVKIIRELTGLGLLECSQLYDNAPSVIAENLTLLVADEAAEKLRALGAEVEVRPHGNPDGIEDVLAAPGQKLKGIYTLTGNRLDTPFDKLPSGIYIVNGKKVTKK